MNIKQIIILLLIASTSLLSQVESQLFLEGAQITDIKQEEQFLWIATYGQGIYQYSIKDGKWKNFSTKSGNLENDLFYNVAADKDFVWAGSTEGLFIYSKKTNKWTKRKFAQGGEFGNWIRDLQFNTKRNELWIGRFRNLTIYDAKTRKYDDINRIQGKDEKTNIIKTISFDGDSLVWLGTESGIHKGNLKKKLNDPDRWQYINNKGRGFGGEGDAVSVSDIIYDGKKIWFATDEFVTKEQPEFNLGGIYIWDRRLKWERISKANGLGGNGIYCMARTGNFIWAGVYEFNKQEKEEYGKGLYLINRITKKVVPVNLNELDINSSSIFALYFDKTYLWIGTSSGLVRLTIGNQLASFK